MKPVAMPELAADPEPTYVEIGKHQPQYQTLPALVFNDGKVLTEWELTEAERLALIRGERIRLWVWSGGKPIQPVWLEVTSEEKP